MRTAPYTHCPPSRTSDRQTDGNSSPRTPGVHSPRSILRNPNPLHTSYFPDPPSQQPHRPSHPLTSRLDIRAQAPWTPRGYESKRHQYDPAHHPYYNDNYNYQRTPHDSDSDYHSPHHKRTSLPPHAFRHQYQQNGSRDHFVSMPDIRRLPRPLSLSIDVERDRQARACGQPPPPSSPSHGFPLDHQYYHLPRGSKRFEDDQRHHRDAKTPIEPPKPPPPHPKPHLLYPRLDKLVRRDKHRAMDHVSFDEDVLELYRQDAALREKLHEKRRAVGTALDRRDPKFHVIGAPLRDVLFHASSTITIGEHQHEVPIVVVACVEELTRTGIYQQGLFRTLPSRDRHLQLIDIYDSSADYGQKFSMHGQTMPDICAVLSTFISSLPQPILDARLYSGFWHWCVKPCVKREDVRRHQQDAEEEEKRIRGELPLLPASSVSGKHQHQHSHAHAHAQLQNAQQQLQHSKTQDDLHLGSDGDDLERHQIMIAQIILRFLPTSHLSLLIYLCGFFTQLPLCPENGIEFEDIARIFGSKVFSGGGGGQNTNTNTNTKVSSQKMMVWLLTRWGKISEGILGDGCGMSRPGTPGVGVGSGSASASATGSGSDPASVNA